MRTRYKFVEQNGTYFITATIVEWLPVFTSEKYFEIVIDSLKFCQINRGLEIYAYVVLDNHLHLVVSGPEISKTIASFKKFTARNIVSELQQDQKNWLLNQLAYFKKKYKLDSVHQVWQEGVHPQLITSEDMLKQKIEYIHNNPVKRGLIDQPEYWRYSSARYYILGDDSILGIQKLPV